MFDSEYATVAVVVIALAAVAPLAATTAVPAARHDTVTAQHGPVGAQSDRSIGAQDGGVSVGVRNLSAESVALRNVTATDVVVRNLTVRRMGQRRNVTLQNVSLRRVLVERARLTQVRIGDAVIRSRDLISAFGVPYVRGLNVTNRSFQRVSIRNQTVDGVVVGSLTVQNASGLNLSVPADVTGDAPVNASSPDLTVGNISVSAAESLRVSFRNATAANSPRGPSFAVGSPRS